MSKLCNLFNRKGKRIVGIDIGSGFLKVAEIDYSRSQPALVAAGACSLPREAVQDGVIVDAALLVQQLHQLMLSAGCSSKEVAFSVGGRSTFVREVLFPVMNPDELKEAITWDIEKYVPYASDTYYYDYSIVGKTETDLQLRVLVAAALKEAVDALVLLAKEAALNPVAVDIDALAAGRALGEPDSTLLVDIGDAVTQITVFQRGCPVAMRTVGIGGRIFTADIMSVLGLTYQEAELLKVRPNNLLGLPNSDNQSKVHSNLEARSAELGREIIRTSEYYKMQNKSPIIDKVVLTGGGAKMDNLPKHLEWQAGMPVTLVDPLNSFHSSAAFDPHYIRGLSPQLTVAVGLSMWGRQA